MYMSSLTFYHFNVYDEYNDSFLSLFKSYHKCLSGITVSTKMLSIKNGS